MKFPQADNKPRMHYRAGRTLTGLSQTELAKAAGLTTHTISRLERGSSLRLQTLERVTAALRERGVVFEYKEGHVTGVRLEERK